jgi:DNA-binding response OmpR family regulator
MIFLVEEDDETRRLLKQRLQKDGYQLMIAVDEQDALERSRNGHVCADLILVNLVGKSVSEGLAIGRRVREHAAKYETHTPLVNAGTIQ